MEVDPDDFPKVQDWAKEMVEAEIEKSLGKHLSDIQNTPEAQDWAMEMVEAEIEKSFGTSNPGEIKTEMRSENLTAEKSANENLFSSKEEKILNSKFNDQSTGNKSVTKKETCWDMRAKLKSLPQSPLTEKDILNKPKDSTSSSPQFDLRQKLSRPKSETKDPVLSPSKYDLRQKLSKGFNRDQEKREVNLRGQRQRGGRVTKSKASEGPGSPLRSPRNVSYGILDMDNSCTYRNSRSSRSAKDQVSPSPQTSRMRKPRMEYLTSDKKSRSTDKSNDESESSSGKSSSQQQLKTPGSRRKLKLQKDEGEVSGDESHYVEETNSNKSSNVVDPQRLARKEKDISYGKSTDSYQLYLDNVPKSKRSGDLILNPKTPDKSRRCSRRSWDTQIKLWKRRIHSWALSHKYPLEFPESSDRSLRSESPTTSSIASLEESLEEDDSPAALPARRMECSDDDDDLDLNQVNELDHNMIKEKVKIEESV